MAASWSGNSMNSTTVHKSQIRHNTTQITAAVLNAARSSTSHPCALRNMCLTKRAAYLTSAHEPVAMALAI